KVPCAIHCSPEALGDGPLAKLRDGDLIRMSAETGELVALVDEAEWNARVPVEAPPAAQGMGREMFSLFRASANEAEKGASAVMAAMGW
ncbi:MAG: dihydroxy-acid dehydratase, partial [Sphingomonas sp.]